MKHKLLRMLLLAALLVPIGARAQVTCNGSNAVTVSNADTSTTTTSYFPGYSYYNYSYSEEIVPADRLTGIGSIQAFQFKPTNTAAGSSYFNNCEIYLALTSEDDLSAGWSTAGADAVLVWSGDMSFTTTGWQTIVFDDPFVYDGTSNLLVIVRRNHGSYALAPDFAAFSSTTPLARYVYRDGTGPYSVTPSDEPGYTSTNPGWYRFLGCDDVPVISCNRVRELAATNPTIVGATLSWRDTANSGASYTIFNMADTSVIATGVTDTFYTITSLAANTVYNVGVVATCGAGDTSAMARVAFRTACAALEALPWTMDFESETPGSSSSSDFVPCMNRFDDGTSHYPYLYNYYGHNGPNCLYWYRYTGSYASGTYNIVTLPEVNTDSIDLNETQVRFWAMKSSGSPMSIVEVGVMMDPEDRNTFIPLHSFQINNSSYEQYTAVISGAPEGARCVAFSYTAPGSYQANHYVYIDEIVLEQQSACPEVYNLTLDGSSTSGATISWGIRPGTVNEVEGWNVSYLNLDDTAATLQTASVTEPHYAITGLTPSTNYRFWVTPNCGTDNGLGTTDSLDFATVGFECAVVDPNSVRSDTIGNGTSTGEYIPTNSCYNYSLTQQLFTAAELGASGQINSLAVQPSFVATPNGANRTIEIYLAHTADNSLSDFVYPSDLTLVYSGTATYVADEWHEFEFDTPFLYNGSNNLVVMFRDLTGSYSCSNYYYTHTASAGSSVYVFQDGGSYPIGTTGGSVSSNRCNMVFNMSTCQQTATCAAPVLSATAVETESVDLSWVPGASETEWDLYYREQGDTVWTEVNNGIATTTYTVNNLSSGHAYEFRLVNNCTEGSYESVISVTTACGSAVSLPLTENLQSIDLGTIYSRSCWTTGSKHLGPAYDMPLVMALTGDEENHLLMITSGSYIILPKVDADLGELELSFKLTQVDSVRLLLGLLPDATTPIDSLIVIDTMIRSNIDTSMQTVNMTYRFDDLDDEYQNYNIVFYDAFYDNFNFIDDLVLDYIPACSAPTGLQATNVTVATADISWTAGESGTGYTLEYGPAFFTPGTGTTVVVSGLNYSLSGLNPGTTYDVYVYTECSGLGSTSSASQVVRFTTPCAPITSYPYTMTFEGLSAPGYSGNDVLPNCWTYEYATPFETSYPPYVVYTTNTNITSSPSHCFYFQDESVVAMPENGVAIDSLMISFHAFCNSPVYGLVIGAVDSVTPGFSASFQPIDTVRFRNGVYSYEISRYLSDYNGTGTRIAFKNIFMTDTSSHYSYIYIDDVVVDRAPTCIAPQNVRVTSRSTTTADLAWNVSQASNYSVEYGPTGFTPGTGITTTTNTRSLSLTGLTAGTSYDVRIVSLCSATEHSDTTVFTFRTMNALPVTTLPYYCDFADAAIASAWEIDNSAHNKWYIDTAAHYGTADNKALYISNDNGITNDYRNDSISVSYAYRTFQLDSGVVYGASFNWMADGESDYDYIRAFLVPASVGFVADEWPDNITYSSDFATHVPAGWIGIGSKLNQQSDWQFLEEDHIVVDGGLYNLLFIWSNDGSAGSNPAGAIDNVEFYVNTCPAPTVSLASAGTDYLNVTWAGGAEVTDWQLEYGLAGHQPGTGTIVNVSTPSYHIGSLPPLTTYDVYVRALCSDADTGRWSHKVSFRTALCDGATYAANYDDSQEEYPYGVNYFPLGTSCYNYSFVQMLIPASRLASLATHDITAFQFNATDLTGSDQFNGMDIYLANVDDTTLTSWILPSATTEFVHVVNNANLSFTDLGWNIVGFDTTFTWDGVSSVLMTVNRANGSYTCSAGFAAHYNGTGNNNNYGIYTQNDGSAYTFTNITSEYPSQSYDYMADIQFINCAPTVCDEPVDLAAEADETTITFSFSGEAGSYEVAIDTAWDENTIVPVTVTDTFNTFTGLTAATQYTLGVRAVCSENNKSEWVLLTVTTDEHPCAMPTDVTVGDITFNSANIGWTLGEEGQSEWQIRVTGPNYDDTINTTTNPYNLTGLSSGIEYSVAVRAYCSATQQSPWSTAVTFTTATCQPVSNIAASNRTVNSATISWTAPAGVTNFEIEYGLSGFNQGNGTSATASTNSVNLTGLQENQVYDIYVRSVCAEGIYSEWTSGSFETQQSQEGIDDVASSNITLYPNPATTSVTLSGIAGQATVSVVDMNGRVNGEWKVESGELTIDLTGYAQGAYFVRITGEQQNAIRKLIVK